MKNNLPVTQIEIDYPESAVFITRTDTRGVITYANDSFVEISGFTREELVGKNHNMVRHPDMPAWAFADLWKTVKSGHPWRGLVKNRAKNGDHYWVRATISPITRDGQVIGYLSLRKKPSRDEVAHAETLYRSDRLPNAKKRSPAAIFMNFTLQLKLQIALQPFLLITLGSAHYFIAQHVSDSRVLFELLAGQIAVQVLFFLFVGWMVRLFVGRSVDEINSHLAKLVNGDMTAQMDISRRDEMGEIMCSVQSAKVLLGSVIDQIKAVSSQIEGRAKNLFHAVTEADARAQDQSEMATRMAASIEQMSVSIDQVAENAEGVKRISDRSKILAEDGGNIVNEVVSDMETISDTVGKASATIREMGNKSEEIQNVVKTIKEIVEQTNLLALNAAIEAARAGEHGRGFAVVADEVRKLAGKTRNSAQEIIDLSESIRGVTRKASESMELVVDVVRSGSTLAGKAGDSMRDINDGAVEVLNGVSDIERSIQEQSLASREIAVSVERVAQVSETNRESVREVTGVAANLGQLSTALEESVGSFRI